MANVNNQHSVNLFTNTSVDSGIHGMTTPKRCGLSGGRRKRRSRRRNQRGGAGYGTDYSLPGKGRPNVTSYSDCGVTSATSFGKQYVPLLAQKGGGKLTYGGGGSINYGYSQQGSALANVLKGGYPPVVRTVQPQCGSGKRRRRRRKSRRRTRRKRRCSKCSSKCCACCKCRGKRRKSCRCRNCPKKCCPCCRCKKKHRKRRTKRTRRSRRRRGGRRSRRRTRRRNQRGGYHQYRSNFPSTPGMKIPNGGGYQTANPPTFSVLNNCVDNYNHYKGGGSPSPVLDKTV